MCRSWLHVGRVLLALLVLTSGALYVYDLGRDAAACPPAPPARSRYSCPMHGYGWQLPGSAVLFASVYSSDTRWGNELSRYWQARGMARLGGLSFVAVGDFTHAWLRYLPLYVPAPAVSPDSCDEFDAACAACGDWKYSHKCLGGWTVVGDEVVADTRAALVRYAAVRRRCARARVPDPFRPPDAAAAGGCPCLGRTTSSSTTAAPRTSGSGTASTAPRRSASTRAWVRS
jgi:hypothetical protein